MNCRNREGGLSKSWKSSLSRYRISRTTFETILESFSYYATKVKKDEIYQYFNGYTNYNKIYFTHEYLICPEYILRHVDREFQGTSNKQCICRLDDSIKTAVYIKAKSGLDYYNDLFGKAIKKVYPNYEDIIKSYTTKYDSSKSQLHYFIPHEFNKIEKHEDVYYYDLNGAYCSILCQIFPEAKEVLIKLYNKKHKQKSYKNLYCFAVGYLVRKGYTGLYNYIVQQVREIIDMYIGITGGILLYANTDGFMVEHPVRLLKDSKELGEFKCEYHGIAYTYRQDKIGYTPYDVIQYGNDIKGTARTAAHKCIDLANNKVATYNIIRNYINWDKYGDYICPDCDDNWFMKTINIESEKLNG